MSAVLNSVGLDRIDLDDDRCSCSYPPVTADLEASIARVGVLHPPTLAARGGVLRVASGLRRLRIARRQGLAALSCFVIEKDAPPESRLFLLNLEDNLGSRALNLFERARAVRRIRRDFEDLDEGEQEAYLDRLDVPRRGRAEEVRRLLKLDGLEDRVKGFVLDRDVPEPTACRLPGLGRAAALELADTSTRFRLTASQIRELILLCSEIAARDGVSFLQVLHALRSGVDPQAEGDPKGREAFFRLLKERRFPDFTETVGRLEAALAPINGTAGIRVTFPPNLEGDTFTARIAFRSGKELADRARALVRFASSPDLAGAWELLEP